MVREGPRPGGQGGYTLVELLLALVVSVAVAGGATVLAGRMQSAYRARLDAAMAQQEGRYILGRIEEYVRSAGNNPYRVETTACPTAGTTVMAIRLDPDGNGVDDDIRLQSDARPANGLVGGSEGACTEPDEDVTIAFDPAAATVTITDNNLSEGPRPLSDAVVRSLEFVYRNSSRQPTSVPAAVSFVETRVTVESRLPDLNLGTPQRFTVSSEVRVRSR